jgi:Ca2+-binding EF-hand superfamily protein
MKKILMFTTAALVLSAPAVMAKDGGGSHHKGRMFEKLDLNGDGVVTREEFNKAHEERFNKMDADSDGKVTKEEAQKAAEEWHAKMKEHRKERMDKRGDGSADDSSPAVTE